MYILYKPVFVKPKSMEYWENCLVILMRELARKPGSDWAQLGEEGSPPFSDFFLFCFYLFLWIII